MKLLWLSLQKDIAKMANVSQSTVSRCLNDSPMISEKQRKKVLKKLHKNTAFNLTLTQEV
ncbi:hypothetical protein GCM10020331_004400 [Ectobacillus funiculus]